MSTVVTSVEGATTLRLPEKRETSVYFDVDFDEGEVVLKFTDEYTARLLVDVAAKGDLLSLSLGLHFRDKDYYKGLSDI